MSVNVRSHFTRLGLCDVVFKRAGAASESFDLCDLLMNAVSNHRFLENGQK